MNACIDVERKQLLERELARMLEQLVQEYSPRAVYLYGSLCNGNVTAWSDIDLVIVKDTHEPFLDRAATVLRLLRPRVGLDVCVYTPDEWADLVRERRFVVAEILEHGRQLYAA